MTDLIGQSLGRYHILEQLGEGGMAIVYKAFDTRLESEVAVKVIRTENLAPTILERALKRFEREAKALARLMHPNIIPILDYGEHDGAPYLVMKYVPGGTLKDRMQSEALSWVESVRLLLPIARALDYAHRQSMVHRDVKPSNILITADGEPLLTDFGVAKVFDLEETHDLTGTGMGVGTPEYMAPEQFQGIVSESVDIYALGVVLYEVMTGRKPYIADSPPALIIKLATDPLPRPKSFAPSLPDEVDTVLFKALAKDPKNRYQSMRALAIALEELAVKKQKALKKTKTEKAKSTPNIHLRGDFAPGKRIFNPWLTGILFGGIAVPFVAIGWLGRSGITEAAPTETPFTILTSELITPAGRTPKLTSTSEVTNTSGLGIGSTVVRETDGMTMLYVPAGEFQMGSPDSDQYAEDDEKPLHTVFLDAFWMDKTEVTNAMYAKCVQAGECEPPNRVSSATRTVYYGNSTFNNYPVINVRAWVQAGGYCSWAGGKLPTEAEWEKASRGAENFLYPWGNQINCIFANFGSCMEDTAAVGSYPQGESPFGLLDMAGNVSEWTGGLYRSDFYNHSSSINPRESNPSDYVTLRGGSWNDTEENVRTASRDGRYGDFWNETIGFRCVRDASP